MKKIIGLLSMSVFVLALSSPVLAEDPPDFLLQWGSYGTEPGQFIFPTGIAIDTSGYVYIADIWGLKLNKFSASGTFIQAWQIESEPRYVAADSLGNVYFNSSGGPVYKKDINDQLSIIIQGPAITKGIAVDAYNNIYVQDLSENDYGTIDKYDSNGTFIKTVVSGVADTPLAIDRNNNFLYLRQGNEIIKYDLEGEELARWETIGPWGDIALDSNGNVHSVDTLDNTNGHVKKYSPDGALLNSWGVHGTAEGQFMEPYGIAIDSSGNMYISDKMNMIQKFAPPYIPVTGNQAVDAAVRVTKDANGNLVYTDPETGFQTHGAYVSAVSFKALELRNAGMITQAEFGVIMRMAGNSDVNKRRISN